jgi:thiol-disulfide isomerase/thioredoxin
MKNILMLIMLFMTITAAAQNKTYTVTNDPDGGSLIYNGRITFNDLDNEPTFTWLKKGRDEYKPDQKELNYLNTHLKDYSMVVFLGTWCDDSHELIPKLERLLQMTGYPANGLTMYATDRDKKTKGGEHKQYDITLVPTVILIAGGKEAGRITESVDKSLETDLAAIIAKQQGGR